VLLGWPAYACGGPVARLGHGFGWSNRLRGLWRHGWRHLRGRGLNVAAGDAPADARAFHFGDVDVEIACQAPDGRRGADFFAARKRRLGLSEHADDGAGIFAVVV